MKRKTVIRNAAQGHRILEEQSGKLKEKLESLKQQIQQKKKEKEMKQLGESRNLQNSNLSSSKSKAVLDAQASELGRFLASLQMDHMASKLADKNIVSVEQLMSLQPEAIDQWKDIPVGYRIKLKKQLGNGTSVKSPSPPRKASLEKPKRIQDIVQVRKKEKVFVPLDGQAEMEEHEQQHKSQLTEHEQEEMIQSLINAFNSHDQIQEIQLAPIQKPTVFIQSKQAWGHRQAYPTYRYCWTCLKKLQKETVNYQNRQFCGQNCLFKYKQVIKVEEDDELFAKIQQTQNKFSRYLQGRKEKGQGDRANKRIEESREQQVQIDFDIL